MNEYVFFGMIKLKNLKLLRNKITRIDKNSLNSLINL